MLNLQPIESKQAYFIRAMLYLHAVLAALEELTIYAPKARKLAEEIDLKITFKIKGNIKPYNASTLLIQNGNVSFFSEFNPNATRIEHDQKYQERKRFLNNRLKGHVTLFFFGYRHFVTFFEGKSKFPPFMYGNLSGLKQLIIFQKLSALLKDYMEPTPALLNESGVAEAHAAMLLKVLSSGVRVILKWDPSAAHFLESAPLGEIEFKVNGFQQFISLNASKGHEAYPRTRVIFDTPSQFIAMLEDKLDFQAAVGRGDIHMEGFIPLADAAGMLMERVGLYLRPN